MLLAVRVPSFASSSAAVTVVLVHVVDGEAIAPAGALFDLGVDFSGGIAYDCAPISHFRIVSRERGRIGRLIARRGATVEPGAVLAVLCTDPDDDPQGEPARDARITTAGILLQHDQW